MPLLNQALMIGSGSTDYWMFNNKRLVREKKLSLLPRRCFLSNRVIWFKKCEVVTCFVTGPGDTIYETYWCDPKEFLLYELGKQHGES